MVFYHKIKLVILFSSIFLICHQFVNAQWEQLNGPRGTNISCFASHDSTLYCGTSYNGIFLSNDNGNNWIEKNNGLTDTYGYICGVSAIEIIDSFLLASTSSGIFKSTDHGNSWYTVNTGLPYLDTMPVIEYPMVFDFIISNGNIIAGSEKGVFVSSDNGSNWIVANGLPQFVRVLQFTIKDSVIYAATSYYGIYKSTDDGINWIPHTTAPNQYVNYITSNNTSIIVETDTNKLFISNDNGFSWQLLNTGISNSYVISLFNYGDSIYVGTEKDIYFSSDNGLTWTSLDLINGEMPPGISCVFLDGTYLYNGTYYGVFCSPDNGADWYMRNNGLPFLTENKFELTKSNVLFTYNEYYNLLLSADAGTTWININNNIALPDTSYITDIGVISDTLIAAIYHSGIYFSSDMGQSWHLKNNGLSCLDVYQIAVNSTNIFILTDSCGIYRSSDFGNSWISVNNGLPIYNQIYLAANDSLILLSCQGQWGNDIYQTSDDGVTWSLLCDSILVSDIESFGKGIIFIKYDGITISKDNGHTWNTIKDGLPESICVPYYNDCVVGTTNGTDFYVGTKGHGIYKLIDSTWVPVNFGFPTYPVIVDTVFYPDMYGEIFDLKIKDSILYSSYGNILHLPELCSTCDGGGIWRRNLSDININKHSGNIFADLNNNYYKDSTDYGIPYVIVETTYDCSYYTSNSSGNYNAYTEYLQDTLLAIQPSPYATVYPQYYAVTESDTGNNFAVYLIPNVKDLRVTVTNFFDANPGFDDMIRITYKNMGTDTMSGTVKLFFNDSIDFVSSNPLYTALSDDTLSWDFTGLLPFESRNINIIFYIPTDFFYNPDTLFLSDSILFTSVIYPIISDSVPEDNIDSIYQFISSAYDPNSTEVFPPGCITPIYIASGEKLVYTIRFQNTGTDTAHFVTIIDSLDHNLDIPTFDLLSASHPYTYSIKGKGIVEFNFPDIFLPDSNANELLSHGFVKFSIKPKSDVLLGGIIQNRANIYFDFNPPVVTNTTSNPIQSECGVTGPNYNGQSILIFPNPSNNNITIAYSSNEKPIIEIFDVDGRCLFRKQSTNEHFINIDVSKYSQGVYFIKAIFEDSVESGKFIVQ